MKINLYLFSLILTLLLSNELKCQNKDQQDYVVTLKGDTLHGKIRNNGRVISPDKIFFEVSSQEKLFRPNEIIGFFISPNRFYLSKIADIDGVQDTLFLESLIYSSINLFEWVNSNQKHFYFLENSKGGSVDKLIYERRQKTTDDGQKYTWFDTKYKGQLKIAFSSCIDVDADLEKLHFNKKSLVRFFERHASCLTSPILYQKKTEKIRHDIGVVAGLTATHLDFSHLPDTYNYVKKSNYNTSFNLTGGLYWNMIFPSNLKRISLLNQLIYKSFQTSAHTIIDGYPKIDAQSSFELSFLNLSTSLQYRFNSKRGPFINIGMTNGLALKKKMEADVKSIFYTTTTEDKDNVISPLPSTIYGYHAGIGVSFNKITIEGRYEKTYGSSYPINMKMSTFCFLVSYRIINKN